MPRLPRGMTANMMQIAQIVSAARENGTSYGRQAARCDMSGCVAAQKRHPKMICEVCGGEIISAHGRKRRFCDDCLQARQEGSTHISHERSKRGETTRPQIHLHCTVCGAEIVRSRRQSNAKCDKCKQIARNRALKRYSEKQQNAGL